jgi:hypothetical protein
MKLILGCATVLAILVLAALAAGLFAGIVVETFEAVT